MEENTRTSFYESGTNFSVIFYFTYLWCNENNEYNESEYIQAQVYEEHLK